MFCIFTISYWRPGLVVQTSILWSKSSSSGLPCFLGSCFHVAFFFSTVLGIKSQQWVRMSGLFPVLGGQMLFLQENISTVQAWPLENTVLSVFILYISVLTSKVQEQTLTHAHTITVSYIMLKLSTVGSGSTNNGSGWKSAIVRRGQEALSVHTAPARCQTSVSVHVQPFTSCLRLNARQED